MNIIDAYEKIREGFRVINKDLYNLKNYDYLEWDWYMGCVCAFKFNYDKPINNNILLPIEDIENCNWIIVE